MKNLTFIFSGDSFNLIGNNNYYYYLGSYNIIPKNIIAKFYAVSDNFST